MKRWRFLLVVLLAAGCTGSDGTRGGSKPPVTPTPTPASSGMWIGAFADGDATDWQAENARIAGGKMRVRRSFNPGIPSGQAVSAASEDAAAGIVSFHSIRPPNRDGDGQDMQGIIDGKYDKQITKWAESAPTTGAAFATMSHEPEAPNKKLTGKLFVTGFRHFYQLAKAANPNLQLGPIHMSYQWSPDSETTANPDEWWVGSESADFIGVDDYNQATTTDRTSAENDPNFQRWYEWASTKGKPLAVTEYGRMENPADPSALAKELKATETWLLDHGFMMWLYWDGKGTQADWRMTRPETIAAWTEIVSRGRQS